MLSGKFGCSRNRAPCFVINRQEIVGISVDFASVEDFEGIIWIVVYAMCFLVEDRVEAARG